MSDFASATLVETLRRRAAEQPEQLAYTFLDAQGQASGTASYRELDQWARSIAARLQELEAAGQRALLLYPPGLDYVAAFLGCLYAGVVAVPAYPPNPNRLERSLPRLRAIVADARPAVALTTAEYLPLAQALAQVEPLFGECQWVAGANDPALAAAWRAPALDSSALAFLQYTSGSTAAPKGVMLSHGNLLHNLATIARCFGHSAESAGVIWLPPYHDMGLIGGILQPLYAGFPVALMAPATFLQNPMVWLQAISRLGATTSGGPNFAYDLCVRKISDEQLAQLDLSSWEVAFTGAEPVRAATLDAFSARFAPAGFRREAFYPCYGLAEATLLVSGGPKQDPPLTAAFQTEALGANRVAPSAPDAPGAALLTSCGRNQPGQRLAVVHPELLTRCADDAVGEIWVAGPSVAQGYWSQPEQTAATFGARLADSGEGPFLRTGDLGFLREGELFVTGRLKDLIIIRGRNSYPQDIELTAERSHPGLRPGCGAAFAVEAAGEERLVLVQEVDRHFQRADLAAAVAAIRQAVAQQHEVQVYAVALVKTGSIPKTSSGKIQRRACRAAFLEGDLALVGQDTLEAAPASPAPEAAAEQGAPELIARLRRLAAQALRADPQTIDPRAALSGYGADSLAAVELQSLIEQELGVQIALGSLIEDASLESLAAQIRQAPAAGALPGAEGEAAGSYPLAANQQALWFLQQLAPQSAAYNIAGALRLRGPADPEALRAALQAVLDAHPELRASFSAAQGEPVQHIQPQTLDWAVADASAWGEAELLRRLSDEAHRPFDLERDRLLRARLYTGADAGPALLLVVHHIVADFWSLALLAEELGARYRGAQPAPTGAPYAAFVRRQGELARGPEAEAPRRYWQGQLAGAPDLLNLPADRPRPPAQTYTGAACDLLLGADLTARLQQFSATRGATLYTVLLAAFQALLHRYSGQPDVLVGTPAVGRGGARFARTIGYCVNPLALRARFAPGTTFAQLLAQTRRTVIDALDHQTYPFTLLAELLQPQRHADRSPLFQVMFSFQQAPQFADPGLAALAVGLPGAALRLGGLEAETLALEPRAAQLDLTLMVAEVGGRLAARFQYNTDLFDRATVERLAAHYQTTLEALLERPDQPVARYPLLSPAERGRILRGWNATALDYPRGACLHQLFEAQAARTPERTAAVFEGRALSYGELNARANRLARRLRALGVGPEVRVALYCERSLEMLVGLLGTLKAGGAYIPLDPEHPRDRVAYVLRDAGAAVLLTQERLLGQLPPHEAAVLTLDQDGGEAADNPGYPAHPAQLAYLIYTSGSTGLPKGVQIPHGPVVNFLTSMAQTLGVGPDDRMFAVTTLAFDIAVLELLLPLTVGARVEIAPRAALGDGVELARRVREAGTTVMQATPALWSLLLETGWRGDGRLLILCGGERLPRELADRLRPQGRALWNLYGPTETTIWSAAAPIELDGGPVTIGGPIGNTQLYILDAQREPAPVGVTGELYIGGDGLARGYQGRPELTAERFVPDPFRDERRTTNDEIGAGAELQLLNSQFSILNSSRLYRTGDLARWLPDGRVECLGRVDHQVKIRGYRIETGEIEAVLKRHPAVLDTVVAARAFGADQRLVAYVVSADEGRRTKDEAGSADEGRRTKDEFGAGGELPSAQEHATAPTLNRSDAQSLRR